VADRSRKLEIVIAGDASGALASMGVVNAKAGGLGSAFRAVGVAAVAGFAAVGAAAIGAGFALFKIGETFDEAMDTISVRTGATGQELAGLEVSFKEVFANTPTDAASAAEAIAHLNQQLNATGPQLEKLSEQMLELSRITETDLNTNLESATGFLNNWEVSAGEADDVLDQLFRVTQETGIGFDELTGHLSSNGVQLRALGFNIQDSASLFGLLAKAGLDAADVMPAFNRAMATAAENGITAEEALRQTWDTIASAPNDIAAAQTAMETFGARSGPRLAEMIRQGQLSYENLSETIKDGGDTILGAADRTKDFAEQWTEFKNHVMVALAPAAERVFGAIGDAMEAITPFAEHLIHVFSEEGLGGVMRSLGGMFQLAWPSIREALGRILENVGQAIVDWTPPILERLGQLAAAAGQWLIEVGIPAFVEWVKEVWPPFAREMGILWGRVGQWIVTDLAPYLLGQYRHIAAVFWTWIATDVIPAIPPKLWEFAQAIGAWIRDEAAPWLAGQSLLLGKALTDWIAGMPGRIASAAAGMFDGIYQAFRTAINQIIAAWNGLDFTLPSTELFGVTLGGGTIGTPDIPYLAQGGIVTKPTLAVVGDGGPEAVIPLARVGGSSPVIHNHFHAPVVGTTRQFADLMRDILLTDGSRRGVPAGIS
jgi:TP901 family phage tail tape measure protein